MIRNHLKGAIDPALVKHAYIPDLFGKEKRKAAPGKEGKLGVEGMTPAVLLQALRNAGATILEEPVGATIINGPVGAAIGRQPDAESIEITKTDLYELGLTGRPDSKERRRALQKALGNLSTNALLTALNCVTTREELAGMM